MSFRPHLSVVVWHQLQAQQTACLLLGHPPTTDSLYSAQTVTHILSLIRHSNINVNVKNNIYCQKTLIVRRVVEEFESEALAAEEMLDCRMQQRTVQFSDVP